MFGQGHAATKVDVPCINQTAEAQCRGLFCSIEAGLVGGQPIHLTLSDHTSAQGFQEDLAHSHERDVTSSLHSGAALLRLWTGPDQRGPLSDRHQGDPAEMVFGDLTLSTVTALSHALLLRMTCILERVRLLLLDPAGREQATVLEVVEGVCRVYCPCEETEGMTLAFLQAGDRLRTDRLCSDVVNSEELRMDAVNEWTLQLLRVRHLGQAEQRLQALMALLVNRLVLRCRDSFQLPFRLTHERFGELIGATRVTTTRLLSKWRQADLVEMSASDIKMNLDLSLIESSPLSF